MEKCQIISADQHMSEHCPHSMRFLSKSGLSVLTKKKECLALGQTVHARCVNAVQALGPAIYLYFVLSFQLSTILISLSLNLKTSIQLSSLQPSLPVLLLIHQERKLLRKLCLWGKTSLLRTQKQQLMTTCISQTEQRWLSQEKARWVFAFEKWKLKAVQW